MWPLMELIPAVIGGILGTIGTLTAKAALLVKIQAVRAGVGVHAVQNHLDAPGVGGIAEIAEIRHGAQHGVGSFVIAGVVPMAGKALADGVQIQNGGAKGGNIVHFFRDSLKITAEKVIVEDVPLLVGPPIHLFVPAFVDGVGLQLSGEIAFSGLVKPVGENLIDGGTVGPFRGFKIRRDTAELPKVPCFHVGIVAALEQTETAGAGGDVEIVEKQPHILKGELGAPNVIGALFELEFHGHRPGMAAIGVIENAFYLGGLHRGGNVDAQSTRLLRHKGAEGLFELTLLAVE